jgi:hypothetical protein
MRKNKEKERKRKMKKVEMSSNVMLLWLNGMATIFQLISLQSHKEGGAEAEDTLNYERLKKMLMV